MNETPLFDPKGLLFPERVAHVCAGGETAPLRRHDAALSRCSLRDKGNGMAGRTPYVGGERSSAREPVSLGCGAWTRARSALLAMSRKVFCFAESLDWRDDDNLVIDANEYPSVVGRFLDAAPPKVTLRQAQGLVEAGCLPRRCAHAGDRRRVGSPI